MSYATLVLATVGWSLRRYNQALRAQKLRILNPGRKSDIGGKPAWGALLWALPLAYVFVDPYRRQAEPIEWLITAFALAAFLSLYTLGLIFWRQKEVVRIQCVAATMLAIAFSAYRPSGAIFFPVIAAFIPFSVNGRIEASATLVGSIVLISGLEWILLGRALNAFFFVILFQSLALGAGTTFVARQLIANDRLSRVAERERIASDLHDTLGQTLTAIIVKVELAGRLVEQDPMTARRELADIERISRDALVEMREVIKGYQSGDVTKEFERAISMLTAAGIGVEQNVDTVNASPAQERVLALVLRESVTNIVRHAQATRCRLSLREAGDSICLLVQDDGRGGAYPEGLGIRSIKERVDALGGNAVWDATNGTSVSITLPVAMETHVQRTLES